MSPQQVLTTVITHFVADKSRNNAKPHSICFLPQYQRQKKSFFQSVTKIVTQRISNASSVVWTLIDNGELANQIAGLVAIVVK